MSGNHRSGDEKKEIKEVKEVKKRRNGKKKK